MWSWHTDNDIWNSVVRPTIKDGEPEIICPICLDELDREKHGDYSHWRISKVGDTPELDKVLTEKFQLTEQIIELTKQNADLRLRPPSTVSESGQKIEELERENAANDVVIEELESDNKKMKGAVDECQQYAGQLIDKLCKLTAGQKENTRLKEEVDKTTNRSIRQLKEIKALRARLEKIRRVLIVG